MEKFLSELAEKTFKNLEEKKLEVDSLSGCTRATVTVTVTVSSHQVTKSPIHKSQSTQRNAHANASIWTDEAAMQ